MSPDLTKKLFEKYPKIFADRDKDPTQTLICFGIECSDGWYNIIDVLCNHIQNHIDSRQDSINWAVKFNEKIETAKANNWEGWNEHHSKDIRVVPEPIEQLVAVQVKEKFGTLRFYTNGSDEYIDGLISMAEGMSGVTCEVCGNPGTTGGPGWIRTLCETHKA